MKTLDFLGKKVTIYWSSVPKGKATSIDGIFHDVDGGQYLVEINGKKTMIPFSSVRYILLKEN